jgi:hypothetical protein
MKNYVMALSSCLILGTAFANDQKIENKKLDKLLLCVRKSITKGRMDKSALTKTFELLSSYGQQDTSDLIEQCKSNHQDFKGLPKQDLEGIYSNVKLLKEELELNRTSPKIHLASYKVLEGMTRPIYLCEGGGIEASLVAGLGASLGTAFGTCTGSDGRVWAAFAPSIGFHVGAGGAVMVNTFSQILDSNINDSELFGLMAVNLGAGPAVQLDFHPGYGGGDITAAGVGAILSMSISGGGIIRLVHIQNALGSLRMELQDAIKEPTENEIYVPSSI